MPVRAAADHPRGVMRRPAIPADSGQGKGVRAGFSLARCLPYCWDSPAEPAKEVTMAIGPVQLLVLGFNQPDFHGEIIAELERLRASDTVRVIDSLAVYKGPDGDLEVEHLSNLTEQEAVEMGSKIGALIELGVKGEEGIKAGAL